MYLLPFSQMFSFLYHCEDFYQTWLHIWVTRRGCLTRNCLPFMSTWVHTRILVRSVLPIVLVFFVVCFALFVFVLCLVYPMLSVSLDCQFLITLSVFSNVVMHTIRSFPHSWLITRFSRRVARCVPHLEQERLTLPEHLSSLVVLAKLVSLYL